MKDTAGKKLVLSLGKKEQETKNKRNIWKNTKIKKKQTTLSLTEETNEGSLEVSFSNLA